MQIPVRLLSCHYYYYHHYRRYLKLPERCNEIRCDSDVDDKDKDKPKSTEPEGLDGLAS